MSAVSVRRRRWLASCLTGLSVFGIFMLACGGNTFTNDLPGGGDGAAPDGGDASTPSTDGPRAEGCAKGVSTSAFCSNFDKSMQYSDDGWTAAVTPNTRPSLGVTDPTQLEPPSQKPTSGTNAFYVSNNDAQQAYLWKSLPNRPKHFRLAFDLRILVQGTGQFVPARVAMCPSAVAFSSCYALQFRFQRTSQTSKPVALEEATTLSGTVSSGSASSSQTLAADTGAADSDWARVVLDVTLGSGSSTAVVTFGQTQSFALAPPADVVSSIDHIELSLGAVYAETSSSGAVGFTVAYDTVTFDPDPF